MSQLNCGNRAEYSQSIGNPRQRRNVSVRPQPDIAVSNAALLRHCRRFDENGAKSTERELAEMTTCQSLAIPSLAL